MASSTFIPGNVNSSLKDWGRSVIGDVDLTDELFSDAEIVAIFASFPGDVRSGLRDLVQKAYVRAVSRATSLEEIVKEAWADRPEAYGKLLDQVNIIQIPKSLGGVGLVGSQVGFGKFPDLSLLKTD